MLYRDILKSYSLALHRIKHDCASLKGDYCSLTNITGQQLLEVVNQNSFIGFSGLISYNMTRSTNRVNGTLNVYQLVQYYQTVGNDSSFLGQPESSSVSVYQSIGFLIPRAIDTTEGIFLDQSLFRFKTGGDTVPISSNQKHYIRFKFKINSPYS